MPAGRGVVGGTKREEPLAVGILHPASFGYGGDSHLLFAKEVEGRKFVWKIKHPKSA